MTMVNKYKNIKTVVDGITFDSKAEAKRYGELKLLVLGNEIESLKVQPRFPVTINGLKCFTYVGDFQYTDLRIGDTVVEDVKSLYTAKLGMFRLKKKIVKAVLGIDIIEIIA